MVHQLDKISMRKVKYQIQLIKNDNDDKLKFEDVI
jgi:hypothetical protein